MAAEAALARSLEHESLVATLFYELCNVTREVSEELDIYKLYLIQEYCNGGTLQAVLTKGDIAQSTGVDRWRLAVGLLERIALGMEYMHEMEVVHGSLCPANVMLQVWLLSSAQTMFGRNGNSVSTSALYKPNPSAPPLRSSA
jgi:serine/threonine protein kinase